MAEQAVTPNSSNLGEQSHNLTRALLKTSEAENVMFLKDSPKPNTRITISSWRLTPWHAASTTTTHLLMVAYGPVHNPRYFLIFPTWQRSLIPPNQGQKCFQKAFTESCELHRHKIHSGISYSGKEDGWKMWQMSAGRSEPESGERWWSREEEGHASISSSLLPLKPRLNSALVVARMGQDQLAATRQVKLKNQTIKLRHVLSSNTITWRLRMDNPLKPDQRKSEFWSGLQCVRVFTCRRSWYRQLFTWLQHVIQLENTLHLFMKELCCLLAWKTAECTVMQTYNYII